MKSILLGLTVAALLPPVLESAESLPDRTVSRPTAYTVFAPERLGLDSANWQRGDEKMRMNLFVHDPDLQVTPEEVREMMGLPSLTIPELALRTARTTKERLDVLRLIAKLESGPPRTIEERASLLRLMTSAARAPLSSEAIVEALGKPDEIGPKGALVYFEEPGVDVFQNLFTDPLNSKPGQNMLVIWTGNGSTIGSVRISIPADHPMVYAPPWENLGNGYEVRSPGVE